MNEFSLNWKGNRRLLSDRLYLIDRKFIAVKIVFITLLRTN